MAAKAKGKTVSKSQIREPAQVLDCAHMPLPELHTGDEDGLGVEQELTLPGELGGGDVFVPVSVPQGGYVVASGVVIWPCRRTENSDWEALFPLLTLLSLEVKHDPRMNRQVYGGPETTDWLVAEIDGIPALVRPGDLSVCSDSELIDV